MNGSDPVKHVLIEASAGTGKTQALAKRLIALLKKGVKPGEIIALTFSRDAAGEIFERFVTLLAKRVLALHEPADWLREVIATQHLSQIGTLDSFLMRMVRAFPLELGIGGPIEMMDDYRAAVARSRASFSILRRTDERTKRLFVNAFALAMNSEDVRSFVGAYRTFIKDWHERVLQLPNESAWEVAASLPSATPADLAAAADGLVGISDHEEWKKLVDWVRGFRGSFGGMSGFAKKLVESEGVFSGATVEFSFRNRPYAFGGEDAKAIRAALRTVFGFALARRRETAQGIYRLISAYERDYARLVRCRGALTFSDVPRLIAALGPNERLALEYRLDARIRAWALDEFQDTSREQWNALAGLIGEAKQSAGEKQVFIVGDCKQAIYGWRNGDVGIFRRERDSGAYRVKPLNKSYRSAPAVIEAVNRVFVDGRIRTEFPDWVAPAHVAARKDLVGFVQRVEAAGGRMEDFVEPIFNALKAVDPVKRGIATAVLVRKNDFGRLIVNGLRARGFEDVVWEGESSVLDTPALGCFIDLVRLSDHPGDRLSYAHFAVTPLAAAIYPKGVPDAATVSMEAARAFTEKGLVRCFREWRALLPADSASAWSEFTEARFTDMLRAAADFELRAEADTRLSFFADYLVSCNRRTLAEPGKVKVLTMHRSKGLGFDYVILPCYEKTGLDVEPDGPLLGEDWILPDPGKYVTRADPVLKEAALERRRRALQEALCTYYVAMTRAKRGLTLVLQPAPKSKKGADNETVRFSTLVRSSLPMAIGVPSWYQEEQKPDSRPQIPPPQDPQPERFVRPARQTVMRRLPSESFHSGQRAGDLFAVASARKRALERGTALHEAWQQVEWIDASAAKDEFDRALVRPEGVVALWREKAFECWSGGKWVSGRFDRVVFTKDGAEVQDFKSNARLRNESEDAFIRRMVETYRSQMESYCLAVSALTGLPTGRVTARLLLLSVRRAVCVGIA